MKVRIMIAVFLSALFLIGCMASLKNYPREKCVSLPDDNVVKVIQGKCTRCHTKDYTTKQDICERKSLIINAVVTDRMPKIGKLTEDEKDTIILWK